MELFSDIKKTIKFLLEKENFYPSYIGLFSNPFYFARKGLLDNIKDLSPRIQGVILDVGCGSKPYQKLFQCDKYIGLDIDSPHSRERAIADYFYDGNTFPLEDESFDAVIFSQVLEHVFNPDEFLNEVRRVLRKNGKLLITVPFVWDEHEQPYDYARYSSFGLKYILEKHGFKILKNQKSIADIRVIFQLLNAYIYKVAITKNKIINIFVFISLIAPINLLGSCLSILLPANLDLYLDNVVLAEKSDHELL
jgi:SAM-dependent methyltransferase